MKVHTVFLDSGAHTFDNIYISEGRKDGRGKRDFSFVDTKEFKAYLDNYANFIKKYKHLIDIYVNVDIPTNPELSWRNQIYLEEEHGLKPLPVVHYGAPYKWFEKYMERGHTIIGMGGIANVRRNVYRVWADNIFRSLCPLPKQEPIVRVHGFAMTRFEFMKRYPWYSVDSTSWKLLAVYGKILVPRLKAGKFIFTESPYTLDCSCKSAKQKVRDKHVNTITKMEQEILNLYLLSIGLSLDRIINDHFTRERANFYCYQKFVQALPEWPSTFNIAERKGFGL